MGAYKLSSPEKGGGGLIRGRGLYGGFTLLVFHVVNGIGSQDF